MRKPVIQVLRRSLLGCSVLLSLSATAQDDIPDLSGFWQVGFEREPGGRELLDKLPEGAVFIDDAGGGELAEGDFSGLQLSAEAQRAVAEYDFDQELSREFACTPPSAAFYMQAPFPMEIHQGRDMVVLKMEYYDRVRIIFLDGREHPPADAPHSKDGFSTGYWDGDELVVTTTHLAPATFMNNGFDHSADLRMTERFKLSPDGSRLWLTQVYEDPAVFEGLAARYMSWRREPGQYVYPYDCDPSFGE